MTYFFYNIWKICSIRNVVYLKLFLQIIFFLFWIFILLLCADQLESIVCGTGSGLLSKLFIYPMDVVKKRLQIQGFESARQGFGATRQYSGMISCLLQISSEEGVRGLYKGLSPGLLKAGFVAGVNFSIYEQICGVLTALKQLWNDLFIRYFIFAIRF